MLQRLPSSEMKKTEQIMKWIRSKVDFSQEIHGKTYTFKGNASFSDCQLPVLDNIHQTLRALYNSKVLDEEATVHLERSQSLNRFSETIKLQAVKVPRDGNCLLHTASVAVWSVQDTRNTLRDVMFISVKNDLSFKTRWCGQRMRTHQSLGTSEPMAVNNQWDDIVNNMSNSTSRSENIPSRFSNPLHVYILANVLRRPIIVVTDNLTTSVSKHNLQNDAIGGLYLPLEWKPIDCNKAPIIIGYTSEHFFPLISVGCSGNVPEQNVSKGNTLLFPLVSSDFGFLCVRYLAEGEVSKAWDLVQSYLVVKELDLRSNDGALTTVPCTEIKLKPLAPTYNLMFQHIDFIKESQSLDTSYVSSPSMTTRKNTPHYYHTESQTKTEVALVSGASNQMGLLPVTNSKTKNMYHQEINQKNTKQLNSKTYIQHGGLSLEPDRLNVSKTHAGNGDNIIANEQTEQNNMKDNALTPTAPFPSMELFSSVSLPSMMAERCRNGCGYRCSNLTYPFCHECYQSETHINKTQAMCLLTPEGSLAGGENDVMKLTFETALNETENCVITPTAPLLSMESHSGKQMLSMMTDRCWNRCGYRCSRQTYPLCHECHKLEIDKINQQGQNNSTSSQSGTDHSTDPTSIHSEHKMLDHRGSVQGHKETRCNAASQQVSGESEIHIRETSKSSFESHGEQIVEGRPEITKIVDCDTQFPAEPRATTQCASPYCWALISGPDLLCQKCQNILMLSVLPDKQSVTEIRSQINVPVDKIETDKQHRSASISLLDSSHSGKSPVRLGESWTEKKKLDSSVETSLGVISSGVSEFGSYIVQSSEKMQYTMPKLQHYSETPKRKEYNSCEFEQNPKTKDQTTSEASKNNVDPLLSLTYEREIICDKHKYQCSVTPHTQYNIFSQELARKDSLYDDHPAITQATAEFKFKSPAMWPSNLSKTSPSRSSQIISTQVNGKRLPCDQLSSNTDPLEITTSPTYSTLMSETTSNGEEKSVMVTSMTKYNNYQRSHIIPTDSSYSFCQEGNKNCVHNFQELDNKGNVTTTKCRLAACSNLGNYDTQGFCSSCYTRQMINERSWGEDVPDGVTFISVVGLT